MLKTIRGSLVLTSVLYIVLGVILMLFPGSALRWASMAIGAATLCWGGLRLAAYQRSRETIPQRFDLIFGIILVLLGLFLLISPQFLASLIPFALGVYILVDSAGSIKEALDLKALGFTRWWASFAAALVLGVLGLIMVFRPFSVMAHLVTFIGLSFVFDGVYTLINAIVAGRLNSR